MTEQQLEIAARKLCELRGLDPDWFKMNRGRDPSAYEEVYALSEAQQAIAYALAQQEPTNG